MRKFRQAKTPQEYLSQRVVEADESDCILWTKGVDKDGYGQCRETKWGYKLKVSRAHQLAYIAYVGPIPDGLCVCHKCDTPRCCNPKHLFLGTNEENRQDMVKKGRARNKWTSEASKRKTKRPEPTETGGSGDTEGLPGADQE